MLVQPKISQITIVEHPCGLQHEMATSTLCGFLVDVGAAKDQAANAGATPLFTAAQNGKLDVVRILVNVGATKDQPDNNSRTPLWVAARNGHLDIVRFLVEVGASQRSSR